jgi:SanA protein
MIRNGEGYNSPVGKQRIKVIFRSIGFLLITTSLALMLARLLSNIYAAPRLFRSDNAPIRRIAIVFGAGLWRDGTPSPVLRDRLDTAADLYFEGKVEKLLLSGDNRYVDYNEPGAMRAYVLSRGVPSDAIVLDYAGRRTYDTCYRASHIFGLHQPILVTQKFHLKRALFTCNALGMDAIGVSADRREYRWGSLLSWNIRELPATLVAFWDVYVAKPLPVMGEPEPIFSQEIQ